MKYFSVLFFINCLLVGCTTISPEEFQGYSKDERARVICNGSKLARQRRYEIRNVHSRIEKQTSLLETGYRVHEHCQTITERTEGNCPDSADQKSSCVRALEVEREVCTETPVPIDPYYEETVLNNLRSRLSDIESRDSKLVRICTEKAKSLQFKNAYYLYDEGLEP